MSMGPDADELTLPIKRTDGETLEERLTGNAYHNILPARYLRKDANGDLVEDQEDLFERVANNIALAEAVFEARTNDIDVTVTPDQLKPDHPRRDELAEEVFGAGATVDDDRETTLTEYNVNKFAYETVVPELPDGVREHVEETAAEFQELMERLSFTPNCVPPDSLVAAGGGLKRISDVEPGERVYDDEDGRAGVETKYRNGEKSVVEIETESGYSVRATPEHYFRVIDEHGTYEWQQVKNIEPSDTLALQKNFLDDEGDRPELRPVKRATDGGVTTAGVPQGRPRSPIETPDSVTSEFAEWLGLYVGDGTARESGVRVAFDDTDEDLVERWCDLTETVFGFEPTTGQRGDAACIVGRASRRNLYAFLDQNDLLKESSKEAVVPEAVLRSGRSSVAAFLRGLFDADGTVAERQIELYTHSETLGRQVQTLLLGLGIRSKLTDKQDGYRVSVRKNVCGRRFVERVGFASDRKQQKAARFRDVSENATSVKVPNQTERLLEWYRESNLTHDAYRDLSQFLIDPDSEYHQELGKEIFERYAEEYPELWESPVAEHVERDQIYESVKSVTDIGTMAVEDMQVPRRNTYIVEGFVSHNSPTLMNAGDELQQLSACFVDSPSDDIDDIHQTAKEAAQVFQSGGGMGYAFWRLRPYGDPVGSTGGIASGPITFMRTYDQMCFPPGTRVLTPGGQRPIEELREGDFVIDENGDRQPVVETMERHVDEHITEITPKRLNRPIRATGEHPFKVARDDGFEWVDAEDLEPGDRLVLGHATGENDLSRGDTLDLTAVASGPLVFSDGGICTNREYYGATKGTPPQSFASEVPVEAFATIAGWYLAEGCVVYRRGMPSEVTFTLHSEERDAAREIQRALEVFDVPSRLDPVEERNTLHVHAEHSSFAQFVEESFGTGASQKHVPDVLWNAAPAVQAQVLAALFEGDGGLEKRGRSQRVKLTLTSEDVIDFVFQAGLRCDVQFSRHDREPDDRQPTYEVSASGSTALETPLERLFEEVDDGFAARDRTKRAHGRDVVTVDSVERVAYDGPVYNAEVANTHTYVADDLVVHNCETIAQGGARRGAQMGVMRVSHPDVIQFIHAKNKDVSLAHTLRLNDPDDFTHTSFAEALEEARELIDDEGRVPEHLRNAVEGHLSNFNISVGITDEFMDAVKDGEEFTFTNPRTGEAHVATEQTRELYEMFGLGEYVEVGEELSVPADLLWEHIVEGAHENGEPGVIYLERVNKEHSFDVEEHPDHRILATNPCLTGDTEIVVADGSTETLETLAENGRDVRVLCRDTESDELVVGVGRNPRMTREEADLVQVETETGAALTCTADHEIWTPDGYREAGDLSTGDVVVGTTAVAIPAGGISETVTEQFTVSAVADAGSGPVYNITVDDHHNYLAVTDGDGPAYISVANCGEQPLEEYEACNLGHINLSTLAAEDAPDWRVWSERHADAYDSEAEAIEAFLAEAIDWEAFDYRIEMGTRFLENVVTMSDFPVSEIETKVREMRKIGLGIMGLAQLYIQLGIKYGSETSNEVARQLMRHINHHSKWTSHELAGERGVFAEWDNSKFADPTEYREWFEHQTGLDADDWEDGFPIRNHNSTTIAPTGCVEENSLISTDEGLQPIKNLDETTAEFEQWDEIEVGVSTDGGTKTATAIYDNGFADVRQIETEGGFSIAATPNHRFRTLTDDGEYVWREAGEFEPGDRIVLQRNTFDGGSRVSLDTSERDNYYRNTNEDLELPEEMTPDLAEFLGYFMGDGYVHDGVGVKLVVDSETEELDSYLRGLGEDLFGVTPAVEDRDTRHVLTFGGRHLPRYFEDNGWKKDDGNEGEGAASAFVPEEILRGDEEIAKAFLRGLFEADGTASRKVELSTVSPALAEQVQSLLLSLGCVFVRDELEMESRDDHYGDRPRHGVRGANKREDKRFLDEVGFITKSTEISLTAQSYRNDTYPPAIVETLRAVEGYDSVSKPVRKRVNQSPINGSVSRKLVEDVERETGETVHLDGRRLTDFYVGTVESVTADKAYTKDITVPSNNTYVANGFVTHNTTSMVGNTTGGCEPIYNVAYYKNVSDDVQGDEMLVEFDDYFLRVLEDNDVDVEAVKEEAQEQMANNEFDGVTGLTTVPDAVGELFVTTGDLSAKQHAGIQTACQKGVDSAISKCLERGTLVQTDSGVRQIESFADERPEPGEFVDVAEDVTIDGVSVESQYYAGEKDATRVRVDNGTELVGATDSHKVLTPEGWKVLGELEEGDYVVGRHTESHGEGGSELAVTRGPDVAVDGGVVSAANSADPTVYEKDVTVPEEMSPRLATFLGMYAADGSAIDARYSIEISTSSEHVRDEVRDLFEELFGREPSVESDTRGGDQRDTVYGIKLNSRPVWEFVTSLCDAGSYDKRVPREVLQGSPEEKLAFVNGVTLDGYVSSQSLVVYGGMSEQLADGVAELLRSFGVPKVYVGRKWVEESDAYAYQVHVTNDAQELVTPIEPHKRVDRFDQRYRVYVPQDRVDETEFDSRSREYYAARTFEYRDRNYLFDTTAENLGITDAPPLYEVTEVEDAGTREMYDIELAGPHEYVVGGVVSHNTVNAPNDSTVADAKEVFEYIYDHGGKGVTYYRDGTRSKQVLTTRAQNTDFADMDPDEVVAQIEEVFGGIEGFLDHETVQAAIEESAAELLDVADAGYGDEPDGYAQKRPRPDVLHGVTQRIDTGYGKLYVNINEDPEADRPFELFANIGNSGGFTASFTEALAKTISTALRAGVDPAEIAEELQGIRSPKVAWDKGEQIQSIPDAIGTAMRRYLDGDVERAYPQQQTLEETAEGADSSDDGELPDIDVETGTTEPEADGGGAAAADSTAEGSTGDQQELVDAGESPECPECGSLSLYYSEGCKTCEACGWSEC